MTTAGRQPSNLGQDLLRQVRASIGRHHLLKDGERFLVAVSGGLDSMVLLHLLKELAGSRGWIITVAHFNHQLRARSSDADERLVVRTAEKLGIRVVVGRGDVKAHAGFHKISIEMAARELRHKFLAAAARRRRMKTVAFAHHAGDQAELFFLRLLRGTGIEGLAGMRPRSESPLDANIRIVRPLLELSKASLERYAAERKIQFRQDASNFDEAYLRNRVRLELLPLLKKYQSGLEQTVARLMETARAESDFVGSVVNDWLRSPHVDFENLEVAIQRRCLAARLLALGEQPEFDLIEWLRTAPGRAVTAPRGRMLVRLAGTGTIEIVQRCGGAFRSTQASFKVSSKVSSKGSGAFGDLHFSWRLLGGAELPARKAESCEVFDAASIGGDIRLRHWQPGDRFQPIGMHSPIKLQDFLTNAKVSRAVRVGLVVAEDSSGRIFWVEGCRISEVHKVTPTTKTRFKWRWERSNLRLQRPA